MFPPEREQGQRRGNDFPFWRSGPPHLVKPCHRSAPRAGWTGKAGDPPHCLCVRLPSPTPCKLRPRGNRSLFTAYPAPPSHSALGPGSPSKVMRWVVHEDPHHPSPQDTLMASEFTSCQRTQSFLLGAGAPPAYPVLHGP